MVKVSAIDMEYAVHSHVLTNNRNVEYTTARRNQEFIENFSQFNGDRYNIQTISPSAPYHIEIYERQRREPGQRRTYVRP